MAKPRKMQTWKERWKRQAAWVKQNEEKTANPQGVIKREGSAAGNKKQLKVARIGKDLGKKRKRRKSL